MECSSRLKKISKRINTAAAVSFTVELVLLLFPLSLPWLRPVTVSTFIVIAVLHIVSQLIIRKTAVQYTEQLIGILDKIIDGKDISSLNPNGDNMSSRFVHRLLRLNSITISEREMSATDKQQMKSLISDVSHQVRLPLTNVRMLYETLNRTELPEDERVRLQSLIPSQLDKIEFLMQSLIKASRLENGVIDIKASDTRMSDTVAKAIGNIFMEADKKQIDITVNCPDIIYAVHDSKWTSEAVFNILDNAVKYNFWRKDKD